MELPGALVPTPTKAPPVPLKAEADWLGKPVAWLAFAPVEGGEFGSVPVAFVPPGEVLPGVPGELEVEVWLGLLEPELLLPKVGDWLPLKPELLPEEVGPGLPVEPELPKLGLGLPVEPELPKLGLLLPDGDWDGLEPKGEEPALEAGLPGVEPKLLVGRPARGLPKKPLRVVLASLGWMRRQSGLPVMGSG